jgi:HPt (histidine-containing phosphotransfer) domain-containing protein
MKATIDLTMLNKLASYQRAGQPHMITRLIDLFLGQVPTHIAAIETALASGSAQGLSRAAHALKGASANLGATRLSAIASDLEVAARAADLTTGPASFSELREEWLLVARDLAAHRVTESAPPTDPAL